MPATPHPQAVGARGGGIIATFRTRPAGAVYSQGAL
jgi:hypothetical protein